MIGIRNVTLHSRQQRTTMLNSTTTMTNTTTIGEYVDYRVLLAPSSVGSWRNPSFDEGGGGGWEQWGEKGKECSRTGKPPFCPLRATKSNASTRNPKQTLEEIGL